MGDRTVQWDADEKCDACGQLGAYDFMGDYICDKCIEKAERTQPD